MGVGLPGLCIVLGAVAWWWRAHSHQRQAQSAGHEGKPDQGVTLALGPVAGPNPKPALQDTPTVIARVPSSSYDSSPCESTYAAAVAAAKVPFSASGKLDVEQGVGDAASSTHPITTSARSSALCMQSASTLDPSGYIMPMFAHSDGQHSASTSRYADSEIMVVEDTPTSSVYKGSVSVLGQPKEPGAAGGTQLADFGPMRSIQSAPPQGAAAVYSAPVVTAALFTPAAYQAVVSAGPALTTIAESERGVSIELAKISTLGMSPEGSGTPPPQTNSTGSTIEMGVSGAATDAAPLPQTNSSVAGSGNRTGIQEIMRPGTASGDGGSSIGAGETLDQIRAPGHEHPPQLPPEGGSSAAPGAAISLKQGSDEATLLWRIWEHMMKPVLVQNNMPLAVQRQAQNQQGSGPAGRSAGGGSGDGSGAQDGSNAGSSDAGAGGSGAGGSGAGLGSDESGRGSDGNTGVDVALTVPGVSSIDVSQLMAQQDNIR